MTDQEKFALNYLESPLTKIYEKSRESRAVMQFTEKSIKTTANLAELNLYKRNAIYSTSKAREMLGYNPRFDVDTSLQMSVDWLNYLGLVD